ncbi:hypothetical protein ACEPHQ_004108 [Salmonella enterica]
MNEAHNTRQRVFFVCSACAYPNYGGSGGAAERLAGFFVTGVENPAWATTLIEILNSGGSDCR